MTDEQIVCGTLYRLQVLAGKQQLTLEQFEYQALAIIADAVSAARREGQADGFSMGTSHACNVQAFVERCFSKPISTAEVNKAEEPS